MTDERCPHCQKPLRDLWDYGWGAYVERIETECGNCEMPITIRRIMQVTYEATKASDEGEKP